MAVPTHSNANNKKIKRTEKHNKTRRTKKKY